MATRETSLILKTDFLCIVIRGYLKYVCCFSNNVEKIRLTVQTMFVFIRYCISINNHKKNMYTWEKAQIH